MKRRNTTAEPAVLDDAAPSTAVEFNGTERPGGPSSTQTAPDDLQRPAVKRVARRSQILTFGSLPEWLQDNEYLRTGHRPPSYSFRDSLRSVFSIHSETLNIWTHLLGFLLCLLHVLQLDIHLIPLPRIPVIHPVFKIIDIDDTELSADDRLQLSIYLLGSMIFLFSSFLFHTVCNHSERVCFIFSKLDYLGIAFLVTGSAIPSYYYAFYCDTLTMSVYVSVNLIFCGLCTVVTMSRRFGTTAMRPLRFGTFFVFALVTVIPTGHLAIEEGFWQTFVEWRVGSGPLICMIGAMLYVLRVPERFFPGYHDIVGSSHQLMHVASFVGIVVQYKSVWRMLEYRKTAGIC